MTPTRNTPLSIVELATRVAVTLGALAVYRLGAALPLPGLEAVRLYGKKGAVQVDLTSVFALGVMPLINALLLVEIARLLSKRFNDWNATPANARRINRWALVGTLLLAGFQAYGIAVAFEGLPGAVAEPGPEFRLAVVTTLVGGTALLAWLAALISRYGVGSGLWILLLAPWLAGLPAAILEYAELGRMGVLSQATIVSILAYVLIAVASFVALGLVLARRGMPLERVLIWPLYIGAFVANFPLIVTWWLPAGPLQDTALALLGPVAPLHIAALAVVVIAVSMAQSRRADPGQLQESPAAGSSSATAVDSAAGAPIALTALTALALAAVAVAPYLFARQLGVSLPIGDVGITAAVGITLGIKGLLSGHRA
jgi:preprotein translocase subunit SecY